MALNFRARTIFRPDSRDAACDALFGCCRADNSPAAASSAPRQPPSRWHAAGVAGSAQWRRQDGPQPSTCTSLFSAGNQERTFKLLTGVFATCRAIRDWTPARAVEELDRNASPRRSFRPHRGASRPIDAGAGPRPGPERSTYGARHGAGLSPPLRLVRVLPS